jgi:hypothetical protein
VVGASFLTDGGDWRSIYLHIANAQASGRAALVVNPCGKRGIRQTLATWAFTGRVIVNGLSAFDSWLVLVMCLMRPDIRVYLHETEYALDAYRQSRSVRYRLLKRIFGRDPILCVSGKAETL